VRHVPVLTERRLGIQQRIGANLMAGYSEALAAQVQPAPSR
jgi:hypothetical protein